MSTVANTSASSSMLTTQNEGIGFFVCKKPNKPPQWLNSKDSLGFVSLKNSSHWIALRFSRSKMWTYYEKVATAAIT